MSGDLHSEIRTILARLELCSSASTQSFDSSGGGKTSEHPGGKQPPGDNRTADHWYRERLADLDAGRPRRVPRAHGEVVKVRDTLELLLRDARAELVSITGRSDRAPVVRVSRGVEQIAMEDAPGVPADRLADRLGVSLFQMRRWYGEWGLDPVSGVVLAGERVDRVAEVARLAAVGMGERQIALALGLARGTVRRALGKAA